MSRPTGSYKQEEIVRSIPMSKIDEPTFQARSVINEKDILELAASIKEVGLIEPIILAKKKDRFEVVVGHRRFLANGKLKLKTIKAIVKELNDNEIAKLKLHENLHREDISIIDEARTYGYLQHSIGMSQKNIALFAGKSEPYVSQRVAILEYPDCLLRALTENQVSFSVARELAKIDDINQLETFVAAAVSGGCSEFTAKMWRKQYETTKIIPPSEGNGGDGYLNKQPEISTKFVCDGCRKHFTFSELKPIYLCHDCTKTIEEVA